MKMKSVKDMIVTHDKMLNLYIVEETYFGSKWLLSVISGDVCSVELGIKPNNEWKSIVATTDKDLISDGIASISEENMLEYGKLNGKVDIKMSFEPYINPNKTPLQWRPKLDSHGNAILNIVCEKEN